MQLFISYKRENEDFARLVREKLLDWGYAVWMDTYDLLPGVSWADSIQQALHQCDAVIGILSPLAVESENVKNEWDFAIRLRKWLILLKYEDCEVPLNQFRLSYINCEEEHQAEGLNKLRVALTSPPPRDDRHVDDPFQIYLDGLYDQINHALGQKILATLRTEEDLPEPIALTGESTPQAVHALFGRQTELHPMFVALGVTPREPETTFTNMQAAFDSFDGRMLLLGEPGAGKTMTLLKMGRDAVIQRLVDSTKPLPILGSIPTWNAHEQTPISEWLIETNPLLRDSAIPIPEIIQEGRALLLLDGLDELGGERPVNPNEPDSEKFDPRQRFLEALPANNQILVTCRRQDYAEIGSKAKLNGAITLQPLTETQIASYLRGTEALWQAVQNDDGLREMAKTPLLLSFFAFAYQDHPEDAEQLVNLADSPGDLRDAIFERYVRERYEHEARKLKLRGEEMPFTFDEVVSRLQFIALESLFMEGGGETFYFKLLTDESSTIDRIFRIARYIHLDDSESQLFVETAIKLHYLVGQKSERGEETHRFYHLLLRDYFAAQWAKKNSHTNRGIEVLWVLEDWPKIMQLLKTINIEFQELDGWDPHWLEDLLDRHDIDSIAPEIVEIILKMQNSDIDWFVLRRKAIQLAGKLKTPQFTKPLIDLLDDKTETEAEIDYNNPELSIPPVKVTNCKYVVEALRAIGTPEALAAIEGVECPEDEVD